ncbi:hypothetical protein [Nocardioides taihuensis]|uniref:Uncharacterized protein n=1 Tax=Nocardioides taihuensis TaxID=1835606 RepID=A0ABW0BH99_9ACTN
MPDRQATERLVQHWVTVTDTSGRTHLEARWAVEAPHAPRTAAPLHPHAA